MREPEKNWGNVSLGDAITASGATPSDNMGFLSVGGTVGPSNDSPVGGNIDAEGGLREELPPVNGGGVFGRARNIASERGMGWLFDLEAEEGDEENEKSLVEELDIDFSDIFFKIRCVLWPFHIDRDVLMREPDFWGPFFVVLTYALLLVWGQMSVISWILTLWVLGSFLVFLLARVLGGEATYAQTVGLVGYSLVPLVVMEVVTLFAGALLGAFGVWLFLLIGTLWSAYSAGSLLAGTLENRRVLLVYPIALLYVYFLSVSATS